MQLLILIYFRSCLLDISEYRATHDDKGELHDYNIKDIFSDTIIASVECKTSNQSLFSSIIFYSK